MPETPCAKRETTVPDEIRRLLHAQELCVLATVFVDIPHLSLMGYTASQDCRRLYMATEAGTKKVANIRRNPMVAVLVDSRDDAMAGGPGLALTIKGRCRVQAAGPDRDRTLADLAKRGYLSELLMEKDVAVLEVEAVSFHFQRGTHETQYIELE